MCPLRGCFPPARPGPPGQPHGGRGQAYPQDRCPRTPAPASHGPRPSWAPDCPLCAIQASSRQAGGPWWHGSLWPGLCSAALPRRAVDQWVAPAPSLTSDKTSRTAPALVSLRFSSIGWSLTQDTIPRLPSACTAGVSPSASTPALPSEPHAHRWPPPPGGPAKPPAQPRFLGWASRPVAGWPCRGCCREKHETPGPASRDGSRRFPQPPVPRNVSKDTETSRHASASLQRMRTARFPSRLPPRPCPPCPPCPPCHTSAGLHVSCSAWAAAWWPAPGEGRRGCAVSPHVCGPRMCSSAPWTTLAGGEWRARWQEGAAPSCPSL